MCWSAGVPRKSWPLSCAVAAAGVLGVAVAGCAALAARKSLKDISGHVGAAAPLPTSSSHNKKTTQELAIVFKCTFQLQLALAHHPIYT